MHRATVTLLLTLSFAHPTRAQQESPPNHQATQQSLDRVLPRPLSLGGDLDGAIDELRDMTHVNLFVNWNALNYAGVPHHAPVTIPLSGLPLRDTLARLL